MIELPDSPAPNGIEFEAIDYGMFQRGASTLRVDRAGGRYSLRVSFPPMVADTARKFIARLQRAKSEGLRLDIPLLGVSQGLPGAPVVDGAGQAGKTLNVRGLTPGYVAKEGFWLTIIETDGTPYLHMVAVTGVSAGGTLAMEIEPALRAPFADGAAIELANPFVEGFIEGDGWSWSVPVERLIALSFPLEEYK